MGITTNKDVGIKRKKRKMIQKKGVGVQMELKSGREGEGKKKEGEKMRRRGGAWGYLFAECEGGLPASARFKVR